QRAGLEVGRPRRRQRRARRRIDLRNRFRRLRRHSHRLGHARQVRAGVRREFHAARGIRSIGMVEEQRAAPERPVRNWGIPLGRVAGVPVFLTASWLVLAVLIMITYQGYLAVRRPELPQSLAYLVGAGLVLSLLVSVLLHELGHALTARRFGIGVRGITLELLGGYTELDRDAPSPAV